MADDVKRGAIRNLERARQQHDFSGLRFGNITPTDTDGWFDYQNKCFVFLEFKYGDYSLDKWAAELRGQKIAFERQADSMTKPTLLVLAKHDQKAPAVIDAANASVVAFRVNRRWTEIPAQARKTVYRCVEWFLKAHGYSPES